MSIQEPPDLFDSYDQDPDDAPFPLETTEPTEEWLDHSPLTFGKYKGKTPNQVSVTDPGWLVWAFENVSNRSVCSKLLYNDCKPKPRNLR